MLIASEFHIEDGAQGFSLELISLPRILPNLIFKNTQLSLTGINAMSQFRTAQNALN